MSLGRIPMTEGGAVSLRSELTELKTVKRPSVVQAIATAREMGDLKENAEYHAAKEQQGFIEARIRDIEHKLSYAQIINVVNLENKGIVIFGATVHLLNVDTGDELIYQIVGEDESDIKESKISVTSPIARALMRREQGHTVEVNAPTGWISYEIIRVEYI